jgi:GTPase SAR1 family protein
MPQWLSIILKIVQTLGPDIVQVFGREELTHYYKKLFPARNILILGPKSSGKTSLKLLLTTGKPYLIIDGVKQPPEPTSAPEIVAGKKFSFRKGDWLKLKTDVPGDVDLRENWKLAIEDAKPCGIIYMVDGNTLVASNQEEISVQKTVDEIFNDVLSVYESSHLTLEALHIFVNKSDQWARSVSIERRVVRALQDSFSERHSSKPMLQNMNFDVKVTQLSMNKTSWDEINKALTHFSADLVS